MLLISCFKCMIIYIKLLQFPVSSPTVFCTFMLQTAVWEQHGRLSCKGRGVGSQAQSCRSGDGCQAQLRAHVARQAYGSAGGLVRRSGTGSRWLPCTPAETLVQHSSGRIWVWENFHLQLAPKRAAEGHPLLGLTLVFFITASFKSTSCVVWMLAPSPHSWSPGCGGRLVSCSPPHCSKSRWEAPAHALYFYSHEKSSLQTWKV